METQVNISCCQVSDAKVISNDLDRDTFFSTLNTLFLTKTPPVEKVTGSTGISEQK